MYIAPVQLRGDLQVIDFSGTIKDEFCKTGSTVATLVRIVGRIGIRGPTFQ
jgi:hypothetical protein